MSIETLSIKLILFKLVNYRVKRTSHGHEVRGFKPVTVCFEKYTDKDEILRKAKLLSGSNIYVGEDFSKRVKDQRHELQKVSHTVNCDLRPLSG